MWISLATLSSFWPALMLNSSRFTTSVPTTCEVEYGVSLEILDQRATDPMMGADDPYAIDHNVPLLGLQPETTYTYRARAETPAGDLFVSDTFELTTGSADDGSRSSSYALTA